MAKQRDSGSPEPGRDPCEEELLQHKQQEVQNEVEDTAAGLARWEAEEHPPPTRTVLYAR